MAQYHQTLTQAPLASGQDKKSFPLLYLPAELRNMVYREVLLRKDSSRIMTLSQPALLRTCRQIREEALAMYYFNNKFDLDFAACRSPGLPQVLDFVHGRQTTIETHVRNISFSIQHNVSDLSPYNEHLCHVFKSLPPRFMFPFGLLGSMGKPEPEWVDYWVARKKFAAKLKEKVVVNVDFTELINSGVYNRELLPPVLDLFNTVWLLAHIFPEARKSIVTLSHLPTASHFHVW